MELFRTILQFKFEYIWRCIQQWLLDKLPDLHLVGSNDQHIYLLNNQEVTGTVVFDALSAGSPYQWYYEGGILNSTSFTGETGNSLTWSDPVSSTWYGDFYCQTGAGQSRTITVEGGLILDLAVLS